MNYLKIEPNQLWFRFKDDTNELSVLFYRCDNQSVNLTTVQKFAYSILYGTKSIDNSKQCSERALESFEFRLGNVTENTVALVRESYDNMMWCESFALVFLFLFCSLHDLLACFCRAKSVHVCAYGMNTIAVCLAIWFVYIQKELYISQVLSIE